MTEIHGFCSERLQALKQAFASNFTEFAEEGAALAVIQHGELQANLWAGTRDRAGNLPWQEETCVNVFSAGKPLVAALILRLMQEGKLQLDEPVATYWPEFARNGKAPITIRQVLNHTSGLSAFHPKVKDPVIFNRALVNSLIEYEEPWWEPGLYQGYSPFLYGWILAEVACRVSGVDDYNRLFQAYIAEPLGMRAYVGVPASVQPQLADVGPLKKPLKSLGSVTTGANSAALGKLMKADPRGVTNRAFTNPMTLMSATNTAEWRNACIPAANCHTNALSLARFYAATLDAGWQREGAEFFGQSSSGQDRVLGVDLRFGLGFMLSQDTDDCRYGGALGYGHPGAGGSVAFADPETGTAFAYVTARLGQSLLIDERAQILLRALASA